MIFFGPDLDLEFDETQIDGHFEIPVGSLDSPCNQIINGRWMVKIITEQWPND